MAFRDDAEREARQLADRLIASADAHADKAARQAATTAQAAADALREELRNREEALQEARSECARLSEALQTERTAQARTERALSAAEKARQEAEARVRDLERILDKANAEYEAATAHYRNQVAAEASAREIIEGCLKAERAASRLRGSASGEADALERVRTALVTLASRTTANDLFEALLDQLAADFTHVALFVVHQNHLEGWSSRGLPPAVDISNVTIPLSSASPLTLAAIRRQPAALPAGNPTSLFGGAVACGLAFPLVADDAVVAVVYVEQPQTADADVGPSGEHVARILSEQVSRHLTTLDGHAVEPSESADMASSMMPVEPAARDEPAPATRVPLVSDRVKMFESRAIRVDRTTGVLVDLSRSGAQVLLPCALRPQQTLRLQLPGADGTMRCKGRVVWARFEVVQAAGSYRAGIQFTEIDAAALEAFLGEHELRAKEFSHAG